MKLELTERDILLLKLTSCILIAFLMIRFLIMPGIEHYQDGMFQRQELEDTAQEIQDAIDSVPSLKQSVDERTKELKEASSPYYARMENRQVDELLTGLALQHGLSPLYLNIEDAVPGIPAEYLYIPESEVQETGSIFSLPGEEENGESAGEETQAAASDREEELEAAEESAGLSDPADTAGNAQGRYILTGTCTLSLRGQEADIMAFIDEMEQNYPSVQIRAMSRSNQIYLDTGFNLTEEPTVSLTLAVYMYDGKVLEEQ